MHVAQLGLIGSIIYPKQLAVKANEIAKGFYDYRLSGPLLACIWKDKRIINFLSTIHIAEADVRVPRVHIDGTRANITSPPCLPDYQQFMRGVDMADQRIGYYNVGRHSKKWWKGVFSYGIEVAALNSFICNRTG